MTTKFRWPVPENPPDEGVFHTCQFNEEWLPVVVSVLQTMMERETWEDPPDDITDQVATLMDLILTNLD